MTYPKPWADAREWDEVTGSERNEELRDQVGDLESDFLVPIWEEAVESVNHLRDQIAPRAFYKAYARERDRLIYERVVRQ